MSNDLRIKLAKSKIEGQQENTSPWPPGVWAAAHAAYKSGWTMPEKRHPVVISPDNLDNPDNPDSPDNPVFTREKLQELAGLPLLPEVMTTTKTTLSGKNTDKFKSELVQICDINSDQLERLKERTDGETIYVWFKEIRRAAWLVRSVK